MKKLGTPGRAWLKSFHIFFVCLRIGAGATMLLLAFVRGHITSGEELWAVNKSIKLIDDYIIIPTAMGCLITGLLFSWLTNWGFFKHIWIIIKYLITIEAILFGTFCLGPWTNGMEAISKLEGLAALQNSLYLHFAEMIRYFSPLQVLLLVLAAFISVFKPWGKRSKTQK
ncbi:MAG: hypothetical protein FWC60_09230 [Firmicutes bacterium]|nr:hypothetical protein [Bacillota bacterium]